MTDDGGSPYDWKLDCVGRDHVRGQLQDLFDEVATPNANGEHSPQFRILLGLSGIGKTRVVQELYRWLTFERDTNATPTGYWPDSMLSAESDSVNPAFKIDDDRPWTEIPFLWWGIKFEQGNQPGDALYTGLKRLPAHTTAAMAKRLDKKHFVTNVKRLAGFGLDLVPVVGQIKTGYGLVKELKSIGDERKERLKTTEEGMQSIASQEQRERIKWSDTAIESLRQFMDDRDTAAPTVPVVLFLDDAHWIDPVTMQFVSDLCKTAIRESWPLLVIATHWADEWKSFEADQLKQQCFYRTHGISIEQTPQNLVQFLNQLVDEPRDSVETIDLLGVEADAMGALIRNVLPGIEENQISLLLDKARAETTDSEGNVSHRCNPRMITLMMEVFQGKPRDFFVDGDPLSALSEAACRWVKNEVDRLDLESVVLKRFEGFEDDVQLALGWSSLQGRRFLVEITQEIAKQISGPAPDATAANLKQSENPKLWVERIPSVLNDPSRFNLCAFRQRIFHDVAAKNFTIDDKQRDAVDTAVSDVLRGWLESGRMDPPEFQVSQNGHGLTREELRDLLVMAVHRFDPTEEPTPYDSDRWGRPGRHANAHLYGIAAAKLARLNADDGLWEQAEIAALKFADAFSNGCSLDLVNFNLQIDVVDLLRATHKYEQAWSISNALVEELEAVVENGFDPSQVFINFSASLQRRGDCELARGNPKSAKVTYLELAKLLEKRQPNLEQSFAQWALRSTSLSLHKVGDVEMAEGGREAAEKRYRESLEISQRIVKQFGESPLSLRDVTLSMDRVGTVELIRGKHEAAVILYRKSLEIRQRIVEQFGESPQSLRDVALSLGKVGEVRMAQGKRETALKRYHESLEIRQRIAEQFGESPQSLGDVTESLIRVGALELAEGDREAALKRYHESLEIHQKIIEQFGETLGSLSDLALSLIGFGDVELHRGDREAALKRYREGLEISQRIVKQFGESPQSLNGLFASLIRVGDVEVVQGDREAALKRYRESLEISQRMVKQFGESPINLRDLTLSLDRIGDVELAQGDREAAVIRYRKSLGICQRIVKQFGESSQSLTDLTCSLNSVGDVELAQGDREAALKRYRKSLEISQRIVEQFGESPQSLSGMVIGCIKMYQVAPEAAGDYLTEAKYTADVLAEKNWLTSDQSNWPKILKQLLDSPEGEVDESQS